MSKHSADHKSFRAIKEVLARGDSANADRFANLLNPPKSASGFNRNHPACMAEVSDGGLHSYEPSAPGTNVHGFIRGMVTRGLTLAALTAIAGLPPSRGDAQEMDLSRIGAFESLGTGTVRSGAPPKTLVDDDLAHAVVLTIWNSEGDSKVYWKPVSGGEPQTTVIHGTGVRAFQTNGLFKIQAIGEGDHEVQYGYVLFRLKKE